MSKNNFKFFLLKNTDKMIAYSGMLLGAGFLLLMAFFRLHSQIGVPLTMMVVSITYILFRDSLLNIELLNVNENTTHSIKGIPKYLSLAMVIFVALAAFVVIWVSVDSVQRPRWIFIVLSLIPAFILATCHDDNDEHFTIIMVMMLAVSLVLSTITIFPYDGGDTWIHLHNANLISKSGSIESISNAYRDYPLYPAFLSIISSMTYFDISQVARLTNVFVALISILLIYSLSKKIFSPLQSLVVVLLLLGSKWFIYWVTLIMAMSFAMILYCLLYVVMFRALYKEKKSRESAVIILVASIVPFFHPVVTMTVVMIVIGFGVLEIVLSDGHHARTYETLKGLAIYVVVLTLAQWMFFSDFIFERTITDLTNAFFRDGELSLEVATAYRSLTVTILDEINFYFLLGLSGLEMMRQIRFKTEKVNLYAGFLGLWFIGFGYAVQLVALKPVVPDRWFLFGCLLLVLPASSAFMSLFRHKSSGRILASFVIVAYFLTGLGNNQVNKDNPFYGGNVSYHMELTSSEYAALQAVEEVINQPNVSVNTDSWLSDYLQYVPGGEQVSYWQEEWNPLRLDQSNMIFPKREAYLKFPYVGYSFMGNFASELEREQPNISQFYDSGDMQWLERIGEEELEK